MHKLDLLNKFYVAWLPCLLIIAVALFVQSHIVLHADNIYLLHTTRQWLSGASYAHGFFEPNPPLIMLLYAPVVLMGQYTNLNIIDIFYGYITLIAGLSLWLCYQLFQQIFVSKKFIFFLLYFITASLVLLPIDAFGQRENLLVMLALPYVWLTIARVENKSVGTSLAILIGILAGVGICLKPYFVTLPVVIETAFILYKKNMFAWVRDESLMILFVAISYFCIICWFFPSYINIVLPMVTKYYYMDHSFGMLINPFDIYVIMILLSVFALSLRGVRSRVLSVLSLALIALLFSYVLSGKTELYHQLPMLSMAVVLSFCCYWPYVTEVVRRLQSFAMLSPEIIFWVFMFVVFYFVTPLNDIYTDSIEVETIRFILAMLTAITIVFVYQSMRRILCSDVLRFSITIALIYSFYFSAKSLGQYGQLLIIFSIPYVFDVMLRAQDQANQASYAALKGVLLGFALVIDVHLAWIIALLEGFVILQHRKMSWRLPREIVIAGLVYALFAFGFVDLLLRWASINVSYLKEFYYGSLATRLPKNEVQLEAYTRYFCIFVVILSGIHNKNTRYPILNKTLLLSLLGFIGIAEFAKSNLGHYATVPALCLANVLIVFISGEILLTKPRLIASGPIIFRVTKWALSIFVITIVFFIPFEVVNMSFNEAFADKSIKEGGLLMQFFKSHPGSSYDYYSTDDGQIMLDGYSGAHFVGQYALIWWLPEVNKRLLHAHDVVLRKQAMQDKLFLVNILAKNLEVNKPQFVLVQIAKLNSCSFDVKKGVDKETRLEGIFDSYHCKLVVNAKLNYIKMFSDFPLFREAWQHYKYADTMGDYEIYKRK